MDKPKRGRPKKKDDMYAVWEHKYYTLSDKNNDAGIKRTVKDRLFKGYSDVFVLAHDREPNQKDVGIINKAVADIIDEV